MEKKPKAKQPFGVDSVDEEEDILDLEPEPEEPRRYVDGQLLEREEERENDSRTEGKEDLSSKQMIEAFNIEMERRKARHEARKRELAQGRLEKTIRARESRYPVTHPQSGPRGPELIDPPSLSFPFNTFCRRCNERLEVKENPFKCTNCQRSQVILDGEARKRIRELKKVRPQGGPGLELLNSQRIPFKEILPRQSFEVLHLPHNSTCSRCDHRVQIRKLQVDYCLKCHQHFRAFPSPGLKAEIHLKRTILKSFPFKPFNNLVLLFAVCLLVLNSFLEPRTVFLSSAAISFGIWYFTGHYHKAFQGAKSENLSRVADHLLTTKINLLFLLIIVFIVGLTFVGKSGIETFRGLSFGLGTYVGFALALWRILEHHEQPGGSKTLVGLLVFIFSSIVYTWTEGILRPWGTIFHNLIAISQGLILGYTFLHWTIEKELPNLIEHARAEFHGLPSSEVTWDG